MTENKNNIILIGMPGVGKSTIGVILAKELGYQFIDTDLLIQQQEQQVLKDIIAARGVDQFISIENQVNAALTVSRCVIATGGSVVYGREAMEHLGQIGTIVYLMLPYQPLRKRLRNIKDRGVVLKENQTFRDIFEERSILYEQYADLIIDASNLNIEETLQKIVKALKQ